MTEQEIGANEIFQKYNFNPYQFAGNKKQMMHLHKVMANYFKDSISVLDLGCGNGHFLMALKQAGKDGVGIDTHDEAISECRSRGLVVEKSDVFHYIRANQNTMSRFDGIYCAHLIEHLNPEGLFELLKLLFEYTKSGTTIVFVTPNFADLSVSGLSFWLDITHVRPYPGILVQRMLESVGFRQVTYRAIYGLGFSAALLKNYVVQKIRFGERIYRPNLVITATR